MEPFRLFDSAETKQAREQMVKEQIASRAIGDPRVLKAMRKIPRHLFVPEKLRDDAYSDEPLPIGWDQTISQPYIVAYMTEALRLKQTDRILEIGTGSGYQTALLAELAAEVYTVEMVEPLATTAQERLQKLKYTNIHFRIGNGWNGWPEAAPFDKVTVAAAAPSEIPPALIEQMKEGGRIVIPVGRETQELIEGEKRHGILKETRKIAVRFVPFLNPEEG